MSRVRARGEEISAAKIGKPSNRLGMHVRQEVKDRIAKSLTGRESTVESVGKRENIMKAIRKTLAYRDKMKAAANKRWHPEELCRLA
jgi:hypothetical protein